MDEALGDAALSRQVRHRVAVSVARPVEPKELAMHFCIGDSAATMRLLCGRSIKDACWTRSPRLITCQLCERWLPRVLS